MYADLYFVCKKKKKLSKFQKYESTKSFKITNFI